MHMHPTPTLLAQPAVARPKRHAIVWLRGIGLGLLVTLAALAAIGLLYQNVATAVDRRNFLPPGQLVDVGGYQLHLYCTGVKHVGQPTVILEQGGGGSTLAWFRVQPEVARNALVCSYDRAGLGWSEPGPQPRDGAHIAEDLHRLLANANIPGPYVLAGHSYGGLYIRAFASQYPDEVAGLVLLDSAHPDQWTRTPEGQAQFTGDSRLYSMGRILARFGLLRFGPNPYAATPSDWPANIRAEWRALASTNRFWDATEAESRAILNTMSQLHDTPSLSNNLPLAVATAGLNTGADGQWRQYQAELAALSTNSTHVIVEGADHAGLWADPRFVPATVAAILDVIKAVQTGTPLE